MTVAAVCFCGVATPCPEASLLQDSSLSSGSYSPSLHPDFREAPSVWRGRVGVEIPPTEEHSRSLFSAFEQR